jgi:hypothetical protein
LKLHLKIRLNQHHSQLGQLIARHRRYITPTSLLHRSRQSSTALTYRFYTVAHCSPIIGPAGTSSTGRRPTIVAHHCFVVSLCSPSPTRCYSSIPHHRFVADTSPSVVVSSLPSADTRRSIYSNPHRRCYLDVLSLPHRCIIATIKPTKATRVRPYPLLSVVLPTSPILSSDEAGSTPSQSCSIPVDPPEISLQHLTTYLCITVSSLLVNDPQTPQLPWLDQVHALCSNRGQN